MATIAVFTKTDVQIKKMNRKNSNSNFHHEYKKLAKQKNQLFEKKKIKWIKKGILMFKNLCLKNLSEVEASFNQILTQPSFIWEYFYQDASSSLCFVKPDIAVFSTISSG